MGNLYTITYVLFMPLLGILLDRVLRVWFVGARTGRSRAAWLALVAPYAFYIASYGWIVRIYLGSLGSWTRTAIVLAALLAAVGILPVIINPERKWYELTVTGFAWGVAGGLNIPVFIAVSLLGNPPQNYLTYPIHMALGNLSSVMPRPLRSIVTDVNFLLEYLLPALVGYLIGWLRLRAQARRASVEE